MIASKKKQKRHYWISNMSLRIKTKSNWNHTSKRKAKINLITYFPSDWKMLDCLLSSKTVRPLTVATLPKMISIGSAPKIKFLRSMASTGRITWNSLERWNEVQVLAQVSRNKCSRLTYSGSNLIRLKRRLEEKEITKPC